MVVIKLKYRCKPCGKEAYKLKDGHCVNCIIYFKKQWHISWNKKKEKQK